MSSSPSLSKHIPLRYRFTSVTRHAYGRGVNQPQQVTLLAAAKSIGGMHRYAVANEIVAAEIGRFLRLPVPLTGIARPETSTHAPSWLVSLDFNDTGTTLPELDRRRANAAVAARPNLCAGAFVFDLFIANYDRHPQNISVLLDGKDEFKQLTLFDHDRSLLGHTAGRYQALFDHFTKHLCLDGALNGGVHPFIRFIENAGHLREWCDRIASIPDWFLRDLTLEATTFGLTAIESRALGEFLALRRQQLWPLIANHASSFPAIHTWTLT